MFRTLLAGHDEAMTEPDANDELRDLDEQIDQVTRDIGSLRDQLADAGPIEPEERAAILTNREELEGVLDGLRRRRAAVSERLAGQ
jgi:predicted  nucleic acid-binding Zn-ribbon protein